MASIAWPASLPQKPMYGWKKKLANNTIRTRTDVGFAKTRRRYTLDAPTMVEWPAMFRDSQRATLETFYRDTTKGGAAWFDMPEPWDGGGIGEARFMEPPDLPETNPTLYRVRLMLEFR